MFEAGQSGSPKGRPKGSYGGRVQALASLDKLMAKRKSQAALMRALEDELQANPLGFFRTIVMPLLPREAKLSLDHEGVLEWKSLLTVSTESGGEEPASIQLASRGASAEGLQIQKARTGCLARE